MAGIAAILIVGAIIALIWGGVMKFKSGRLAAAPFAKSHDVATKGTSVANPKGAVSVEGNVVCNQPLLSPVTGTPCLYYKVKVVGTWKEGDTTKSKDYYNEEKAAAFGVDDGSGMVPVDARKGGDLELEKKFDETKKEGFFADLKNALGKKEPIHFGNFAFENPPMSTADKFNCTEYVLPVHPRVFVLGKHQEGVITSPSWTSLIISKKTREQLMGATAKAAKFSFMGGGGAMALGVLLGIIAHFTAPKPAAVAAENPPVAAAAIAPAAAPAGDEAPEVCTKAVSCCKAAQGKHADTSVCDNFMRANAEACTSALASFKKSLKHNHKALASCD